MRKIFKNETDNLGDIMDSVENNAVSMLNVALRLAFPDYTLLGIAEPDNEPATPTLNDCWLVPSGAETSFWGLSGLEEDHILHYNGSAWEVLAFKITELQTVIAAEVKEEYEGVILPSDGTTAMTRTGKNTNHPWLSDVALVLLADDLTENEVLCTPGNPKIPDGADLTGASGQVMVRIPKIYYREIFSADGTLQEVRTSNTPLWGYRLHEKFSYGAGRDVIYVGAYEASNSASNILQSVSGVAALTSQPLATFRSRAAARGAGWYNFDYYTQHLLQLLFYVYYADFNSQAKLPGYTEHSWADAYKRNTGRSNALTTMNGSVNSDAAGLDADLEGTWLNTDRVIANRFLFVENVFGHIWEMLDGITFDGRIGYNNTAYVTPDPALFSSVDATIVANYTNLNVSLPASSNENYMQSLQGLFLPKTHGGNNNTYTTDYFWSYLDDETKDYFRVVRSGGRLSNGGPAGFASRDAYDGLGSASSYFGSRLCAAP